MVFQVCPLHTLEEVEGKLLGEDLGWEFTCSRPDHHPEGPLTWLSAPPPPSKGDLSGIAEELGLDISLPAALAPHNGTWVEYGVFEQAFAEANPKEWAFLVDRYGHTAIKAKSYTASAFLAATMGRLTRAGVLLFHSGEATGRWSYNGSISWWALPPRPDWSERTSWASTDLTMDYVPGRAPNSRES